jgi:hypothetical protein
MVEKLPWVAALSLLITVASVRAEKIKLGKVPKAVVDAVLARFPDAKLTAAAKETENGEEFYELSFSYKDHKYDVECTPKGVFRKIEKLIDIKELPREVARVLEEKYPKARLNETLEVTLKDRSEYYEVALVTAERREVEVQIDPRGKVLKEENKD